MVATAGGCSKKADKPGPEVIEVAAVQAIRTGPVGVGSERAPATYALVDVRNTSSRPVIASLSGELVDIAGNPIGTTRRELLTIPAGGVRMFALVDGKRRVVDNASRAEITIGGLSYAHAKPRLVITDEKNYSDEGRAVVAGYLENRGDGAVTAMVIAAFYGPDGVPRERTATPYQIDGGQRRSVQDVGPPDSTRGVLFVADFD